MRPPAGPLPCNPPPGTPLRLPLRTGYNPLSDDDYAAAAKTLGCEVLMVRAMAIKEGRGHGFDRFQRPTILYEPLHFLPSSCLPSQKVFEACETRFRTQHPDLTHFLHPKPHIYGTDKEQWQQIQKAYLVDGSAALKAVSWGQFQILGEYHRFAGFASVENFVSNMCASEQVQLSAFVQLISGYGLQSAMATKDWKSIAAGYNGKKYYRTHYDQVLEDIYEKLRNEDTH
jgi:hypothetical protein